MPVNDPKNPFDRRYVNADGDTMRGPLVLETPPEITDAATRAYVDAVVALLQARSVLLDGSQAMTGRLRLSSAPLTDFHAATKGYVDTLGGTFLPLDGSVPMTGLLTLSGLPTLAAHAASKAYVDALPPVPLSTFDAIVAPAGGDYTSVVAACAGEAVNARIFIKSGTYNEVASVLVKDGQMLIGEDRDTTIIDFGAGNFKITTPGGGDHRVVQELTVQGSIADYTLELDGGYARVMNCCVIGTVNAFSGVNLPDPSSVILNCNISAFSRANEYCIVVGNYCSAYANLCVTSSRGILTGQGCTVSHNAFLTMANAQAYLGLESVASANYFGGGTLISIEGADVTISGNYIEGANGIIWGGAHVGACITGNVFETSRVWCNQNAAMNFVVSGNVFNGGTGVYSGSQQVTISGNTFFGAAFINLGGAFARQHTITGNNFAGSTAVTKIADTGTANLAMGNLGVPSLLEKNFSLMENTSGGALVAGNVVVLKAVAAGDEVTTTVNQGDDLVFGMYDEGVNNNAFGYVQTEGFTSRLKVNGTVAIGIGDFIGTHTNAGIGRQAAAGDMAFAIALEAYAGADDNGVIDALLIKPRKI